MTKSVGNILLVLNAFLGRNVTYKELIHLSFNHRKKTKLVCALRFAVKMMYNIFHMKCFNNEQLLRNLIKELDWNLVQNRLIGSQVEMVNLRDSISLIGIG